MRRRLLAVVAALAVLGVLPASAHAASPLALKGETEFEANAPPDWISETDIPVIGDAAAKAAGVRAPTRPRHGVQVNDPALDHIQTFPGTRPFEFSTQSETSIARFGSTILVGYNSSANQPLVLTPTGLAFVHRFLSGYSVSHDSGRSWSSSFIPPSVGSNFTFGDPSVGVDRKGNFFYATLGADAKGNSIVGVARSTDDQVSGFHPTVIAATDPGADKEWLAIGKDPKVPARDNLYVTWTSFSATGSKLMLAKSTDGGQTFTTSTLFAPTNGGPAGMSAFIQFSNPVVDQSTGRLYVPFLHFSNSDADFIKVLVSDDGGASFHFLRFNSPGAPDPFGFPNVTPGTISDCGTTGGFRLVLHSGPDIGGGRAGLPRYVHATRLVTQPSAAVSHGKLFIAFNASTSPVSGDPTSRSEIRLLYSPDGGSSWKPTVTVARATAANPQHVHPALSIDSEANSINVGYYVQQSDGRLRVDLARAQVEEGQSVELSGDTRTLSPRFDLTPSNLPIPTTADPFLTTNYDRTIRPCYDIGEYMGTATKGERVLATWGDNRNPWTSPPGSPAAGTHPQPDVFFNLTGEEDAQNQQ